MARGDGSGGSPLRPACIGLVAILVSCSYAGANNAFAQGSGCTLTTYADPPRQVLQCRDGLEVSAESAADYSLINGPRGRPVGARLRNRGLFIDLSPGRPGGFQISTPHRCGFGTWDSLGSRRELGANVCFRPRWISECSAARLGGFRPLARRGWG